MIKTKKGLDLPISGNPSMDVDSSTAINSVAVLGADYVGLKPTMMVDEGDTVYSGQKLLENKKNPGTFITTHSSGVVKSVNRGEKRRFLSLVIETDDSFEPIKFNLNDYPNSIAFLIDTGTLAYFRTRPYNRMPVPTELPSAIFINACDTNPLSIDPHELIKLDQDLFNKGLDFIKEIDESIKTFCTYQNNNFDQSVDGISYNKFEGPHPAGLVGTHIHFLHPVGQNKSVWSISWQEVISIGYLLQNNHLRSYKYVPIGGPNVRDPKILKIKYGSNLSETTAGKILEDSRVISGSVLNGHTGESVMNYLGAFDNQVSVLPDESNDILFNWAMPGAKLHSKLPAFISSWIKPKEFNFNVSMNGGNRAIVPISSYQEIMPLNILTTQLLKCLVTLDIELGEKLGVLELAPEDLALASYVCPSKYDYQSILNSNLEKMYEEFN
ncbi:NADH:ubiquinone reductase (Na(+)-transporting) subunit A [Gammaproteobacteria bacterium]|nr:NADH:ubiquinone reductase (Na(+)-transporting) subunit A [Gammaproteobacteria bacterium]